MNETLIQQFVKLISVTTGLHIREQDREALRKKILIRMKSLKLSLPEQYYQLLEAGNKQNNTLEALIGESEWKELTTLLTTGESYFFRDRGQFKILQNHIFPELIKRKRLQLPLEYNGLPSLRIWSAGCSTGEEPYSIAILLQEIIPDWQQWNISIVGTDLNQEAIQKAKRGFYSQWSFRMVDSDLKERYFFSRRGEWEIHEKIRNMVNFQYGNLVSDNFPHTGTSLHSMDLIICRNVFVYFESKAIAVAIEKFYKTLQPGGYLMTAHAELHGQQLGQFQAKVFPESLVYQRTEDWQSDAPPATSTVSVALSSLPLRSGDDRASNAIALGFNPGDRSSLSDRFFGQKSPETGKLPTSVTPKTPSTLPTFNPNQNSTSLINTTASPSPSIPDATFSSKGFLKSANSHASTATLAIEAETLFQNEAYTDTIHKATQVIAREPRHFGAHYLIAQAYANLGESEKAIHFCKQAISIDSLCIEPYYLLAHLAEERGDIENAKIFLKRIIYLAPTSINAYLELAALYEGEGDKARARKMRHSAVELIEALPPDTTVDKQSPLKARELLLYVRKMLRECK